MVQINGEDFQVYDLDTKQSFLERLADHLGTLLCYLYFPDKNASEFQKVDNIQVEDLLATVKEYAKSSNFQKLYDNVKPKLKQNKLSMVDDIFQPFIVFNKELQSIPPSHVGALILHVQRLIEDGGFFSDDIRVNKIWDRRTDIIAGIDRSMQANKKMVKKQLEVFQQFQKVVDGIPYTKFELESVVFQFIMNLPDISIMELFNRIRLSAVAPFATIKNFYKILKDFIPPDEWAFSVEDMIVMHVLEKVDSTNAKPKDFTETIVSPVVSEDGNSEKITASLSLSTDKGNLSRPKFIKRFLDTFEGLGNLQIEEIDETKVVGIFYFPRQTLNKKVFADIVMNNPLFASMMSINESEKANKKKPGVYIYFEHPSTGHATATVTEQVSHKGDENYKNKGPVDFPLNEKYVRVKIKAVNIKAVEAFQSLFSRLMIMYNSEYDSIVQFYRQFLPDFAQSEPIVIPPARREMLKDLAPEIFVVGYPRLCRHQPTIIDDQAAEAARAKGQQVMVFPKEDDNLPQNNYVCNYTDKPFPGLRRNPLENKDLISYLPCCYGPENPADQEGSIYRHYFLGEELLQREGAAKNMIYTNKFVGPDKFGTLPEHITKMFSLIERDDDYLFVRKGVYRSKSSFLNCVLEGFYDQNNILDLDSPAKREKELVKIRSQLATVANTGACMQTMYDFSVDEIIEAIRNPDIYFNPRYFIPLLEEYFDCNIFLFNRDKDNRGKMVLPIHLKAFLKNKRSARSIFIYEHIGSESDHAEYPQCELIVRWKSTDEADLTYFFKPKSSVSVGALSFYEQLRLAYYVNKPVPLTDFPDIDAFEQGIDSYGKCRLLRVKYKGDIVTVLTTPIPPLTLPTVQNWTVTHISQEKALEMAKDLDIKITGQTIDENIVKEITGILGNVEISIPTIDGPLIDSIPVLDRNLGYPENEVSVLQNYNKYKKFSRYISEYMFWLYSCFMKDKSDKSLTWESIQEFERRYITIIPDYVYGDVNKAFSQDSSLMQNGRLVVKSQESLKRLLYLLQLMSMRQRRKILTYCDRKVIEQFYVDIADFDAYPLQVVLEGEESVNKWIIEQGLKYDLYHEIVLGTIQPYFIRIPLIKHEIYLAQNTSTLGKASAILRTWFQKGYNPGDNPPEDDDIVSFRLYSYASPNEITEYFIEGSDFAYDARVIGYKIDEDPRYTVLLPL